VYCIYVNFIFCFITGRPSERNHTIYKPSHTVYITLCVVQYELLHVREVVANDRHQLSDMLDTQ
jgi:hypothetical protein